MYFGLLKKETKRKTANDARMPKIIGSSPKGKSGSKMIKDNEVRLPTASPKKQLPAYC